MPAVVRRLGRALKFSLIGLALLMIGATVAPPRWYVRVLAGPWRDPRAPVLIVLGGDALDGKILGRSSYWRAVYAIRAWQEGGFRQIVLSGDEFVTAPMRDFMICQGVPAAGVAVEGRSRSTHENAMMTAEMLKGIPGPYVLLTSDYHMWRAIRAFRKAGVAIEPRPFPDAEKQFGFWYWRWGICMELAQESVKIAYYRFRGWI